MDKKYNANKLKDPIKKKKFYQAIKRWQNTPAGKTAVKKNIKNWNEKINASGLTNADLVLLNNKDNRKKNPKKFKAYDKLRRQITNNDPSKLAQRRKTINAWHRKKLKTDNFHKIRNALSASLGQFLKRKGTNKAGSITILIGCSKEQLISHLEKKFHSHPKTGEIMNWQNHKLVGGWHVDHIKPFDSFKNENLEDIEVQKNIMNYTNLQPLWGDVNQKKGSKYQSISNQIKSKL